MITFTLPANAICAFAECAESVCPFPVDFEPNGMRIHNFLWLNENLCINLFSGAQSGYFVPANSWYFIFIKFGR